MDPAHRVSNGKAWLVGAIIGVVAGIASVFCMLFGVFCCFLYLAIGLVPATAGLIGGSVAAAVAGTYGLPPEDCIRTGAALGLRGGTSAALFAPVGGLLIWLVGGGLLALFASPSKDDLLAMGLVVGTQAGLAGGGVVLGVLLGAAGGALVGAMAPWKPPPVR